MSMKAGKVQIHPASEEPGLLSSSNFAAIVGLPLVSFLTLFFVEPRATPAARFGLGAAFLRDARFSFLRSVLSVVVLVFILRIYSSWIPANFSTSFFSP